jgi:hypothetical protein
MARGFRPWSIALAASLLLHGVLLGSLDRVLPRWEQALEAPPIEVRLLALPKPAVAAAAPIPKLALSTPPVRKRPPRSAPRQPAAAEAPVSATPEAVDAAEAIEPSTPPAEEAFQIESPAVAAEPAAEDIVPPLNPLPPRIDLRYRVNYGFASGEQTLVWLNEGERYTLTSVAAATGLTGMLYRGRFVQTSRGRITARGLQPEEFWDQRGDRRSMARFDAAHGQVTLTPDGGESRHFSYAGEVQDALSLFFQLALTAPPPGDQIAYSVFNGKKLRQYTYAVRGEAMLDTALGTLRTLHLERIGQRDGRFEAWLAVDRHYLPVRVLRSDDDGNEIELRVQSIAP